MNRLIRILNESPTGLPKVPLEECLTSGCLLKYAAAVSKACYSDQYYYQYKNNLLVPYYSILDAIDPLSTILGISKNEILQILASKYTRTPLNHMTILRQKYLHKRTV